MLAETSQTNASLPERPNPVSQNAFVKFRLMHVIMEFWLDFRSLITIA